MDNVRLDTSQQRLREEVREMQGDLDLYFKFLDERMDRLVEALGILDKTPLVIIGLVGR